MWVGFDPVRSQKKLWSKKDSHLRKGKGDFCFPFSFPSTVFLYRLIHFSSGFLRPPEYLFLPMGKVSQNNLPVSFIAKKCSRSRLPVIDLKNQLWKIPNIGPEKYLLSCNKATIAVLLIEYSVPVATLGNCI